MGKYTLIYYSINSRCTAIKLNVATCTKVSNSQKQCQLTKMQVSAWYLQNNIYYIKFDNMQNNIF